MYLVKIVARKEMRLFFTKWHEASYIVPLAKLEWLLSFDGGSLGSNVEPANQTGELAVSLCLSFNLYKIVAKYYSLR